MNKKSRKAKSFYTLINHAGTAVQIDLNNYKVTCTITGNRKSFYHAYLAKLIEDKYDNNIDLFRTTYVSREGRSGQLEQQKLAKVKSRIDALYNQIRTLKTKRDQLAQTIS